MKWQERRFRMVVAALLLVLKVPRAPPRDEKFCGSIEHYVEHQYALLFSLLTLPKSS